MKTYRSMGVGVRFAFFGLALVCAVALMGFSAGPVWGQSGVSTGTVVGQVLDASGATVAGATVTLTDKATGASRVSTTSDTGRYVFTEVPLGIYDITVSKEGFSQAKVADQQVQVGQSLTVNVGLKVGSASTTIEVTASAGAELQSMNATVGDTISGDAIVQLPNVTRETTALATLQPATTRGGNVAGAISDQNTYQLDGANNSNDMDGQGSVYNQSFVNNATCGPPNGTMPSPAESIEQFKVATNNMTADFNGSSGGQISMVTKRGTNQFHGSLYDYYLSSTFGGANTWSNNRLGEPINSDHYSRFGASAGGPIVPFKFLGGKWYIFGNYEGFRFPQAIEFTGLVPSALFRQGIVQIPNGTNPPLQYNLNPTTTAGIAPAVCPSGPCDPRGLGLNGIVNTLWSKYEPISNDPSCTGVSSSVCDQLNTLGYRAPLNLPQSSNFGVVRIDHDFGEKWHLNATYHYYKNVVTTTSQVDIGGALPGDTLGDPVAKSIRPVVPSLYSAGLTTNITSNTTNDLHYNFLRNFWQWTDQTPIPQLPGLGGALEIGGETATPLVPFNVNSQSTRQRFWDGQDHTVRDDISILHGNHLLQFGVLYQRNFDYHERNDNGGGILNQPVYIISSGTGINYAGYIPSTVPAAQNSNWEKLYDEVLGIVSQPQDLYTRSGPNLALNPAGTPMFDQSIIPTYNEYFSDTWHMKPSFTLTMGLGYQIEMPPYELNGKQVELVDQSGNLVNAQDYLSETYKQAVQGKIYNPVLGFATVANVGKGLKYPYNPFYKGLSPRLSMAWNPSFDEGILGYVVGHNKTVIRAGYSRIFGRLNGVDLVLVPLLGTGLGQPVSCIGASNSGPQCAGTGTVNPTTAFRIGTDGLTAPLPAVTPTLPQPFYPGVNGNAAAGAGEVLDPNFRPSKSDEIDLTIQRELPGKSILEIGYIYRKISNEYQPLDLVAVPYMLNMGGQTFENAYANLYTQLAGGAAASAVTPQPFFETALGGASSAYCTGFTSCTAAVASKESSKLVGNNQVYDIWQDLTPSVSHPNGFIFGRSMASSPTCANTLVQSINPTTPVPVCNQMTGIGDNTSLGYGVYNGAFVSFSTAAWHGLTARSNFTWSRALGTQGVVQASSELTTADPWNIRNEYGPQGFDIPFLYNLSMVYQPPFYKNQHGAMGRLLGGWSFDPIFTAQSGAPLPVYDGTGYGATGNGACEAYGEADCSAFYSSEQSVFASAAGVATARGAGNSEQNIGNITATNPQSVAINGNPSNHNGTGLNMFANPIAVYNSFRVPILGIDNNTGGAGPLRGMPTWNLDMSIAKDIFVTERYHMQLVFTGVNVLNHDQLSNPTLNLAVPQSFGVITGQANGPRQIEFGARFQF
ncbi:MAG TPA: carboxypeptidase regulatory-like domain-containing protein [Candidatus Acidoferrales bacterium]|nr:carboxypeptidase regulatory-like domain-containing protein [Candidatus Acidoferrales bacterium]